MPPPQSPKFSGWLDDIIKISSSVAPIIMGATQGGGAGGGGVAKGLAAIEAFGNRVMQGLSQIENQVANMPASDRAQIRQQVEQTVSQLVASLSDGSQVYQAQKGKDAAALAKFKTDANAKAQSILALFSVSSGGAGGAGGGLISGAQSGALAQGQNNLLLYGAIGIIAILLITRN